MDIRGSGAAGKIIIAGDVCCAGCCAVVHHVQAAGSRYIDVVKVVVTGVDVEISRSKIDHVHGPGTAAVCSQCVIAHCYSAGTAAAGVHAIQRA